MQWSATSEEWGKLYNEWAVLLLGKSSSELGPKNYLFSLKHYGFSKSTQAKPTVVPEVSPWDTWHPFHVSVHYSSYTTQPKLLTASLNTAYTIESHFKVSQFKIFLHFRFIFVVPAKTPYTQSVKFLDLMFVGFRFFMNLRH